MASGENVLWLVAKTDLRGDTFWCFRTRAAALKFYKDRKNKYMKRLTPTVYHPPKRATWGPEQ